MLHLPRALRANTRFDAFRVRQLAPAPAALASVHNFHLARFRIVNVLPHVRERQRARSSRRDARFIPIMHVRFTVKNGPQCFEAVFVIGTSHDFNEVRPAFGIFQLRYFEREMRARFHGTGRKGSFASESEGTRVNHGNTVAFAPQKVNCFFTFLPKRAKSGKIRLEQQGPLPH